MQGPGQVCCLPTRFKKTKLRLAQGKQNLRGACLKCKIEFKFFFSPECVLKLDSSMYSSLDYCKLAVTLKISQVVKVWSPVIRPCVAFLAKAHMFLVI